MSGKKATLYTISAQFVMISVPKSLPRDEIQSYRLTVMLLFWLSSCCSTQVHHHLSKQPGSLWKNRKADVSLKRINHSTFSNYNIVSPQCLILSASSITQYITPKSQTLLGNEGHINMCCANSCEGWPYRAEKWFHSRSTVMRLEGGFRWKSKTQPDHHRLRRQSGESTVDDVTTRQMRQKVSRNMFLPGAYKPLPGFSSPRPVTVTAAL